VHEVVGRGVVLHVVAVVLCVPNKVRPNPSRLPPRLVDLWRHTCLLDIVLCMMGQVVSLGDTVPGASGTILVVLASVLVPVVNQNLDLGASAYCDTVIYINSL
jgi:hypothetical protein